VFHLLTWHIFQIIVDVFSLVVFVSILNQFISDWLLSDVLNFTISICLELRKKIEILVFFDNFMEEKSIVALEVRFLSTFFSF
jgi:hypothetical protein